VSELKLYSYYRSSCSYRVRIALFYKGLDFTYEAVHLIKEGGEQFQKDFKNLNPLSQVPCLRHKDKVLIQSLPILLYLEDMKPEPSLLPKDFYTKAKILSFCEMINSGIQPIQNLSVLNYLDKHSKIDKVQWSRFWIKKGLQACELFLKSEKSDFFCFSNKLTLADLFLIPQIYNAVRFNLNIKEFPLLHRINQNCLGLEAFQKASPENQVDSPK